MGGYSSHIRSHEYFTFKIPDNISTDEIMPAGARVLDVGVGTGSSLDAYPRRCEVVGIDLSDEMLLHAREKVRRLKFTHEAVNQNIESSFQSVYARMMGTYLQDFWPERKPFCVRIGS